MTARERLPNRRHCETIEFAHGGLAFTLCAGFYRDGRIAEIFLSSHMAKYGANVELHRIALTYSDITIGDLPSFSVEAKAKDPRYKWFKENFGNECWELDALPPPILRERVQQAILSHLEPLLQGGIRRAGKPAVIQLERTIFRPVSK